MKPWNERSNIEASLFNPAFCGELILHAVASYNKTVNQGGFPYALAYIVLPFLLSKDIYEALPSTSRTGMVSWLYTHRHLTTTIVEKTKEMKVYTNESLLLYVSLNLLAVNDRGSLEIGMRKMTKKRNYNRTEVDQLKKRAVFIGSWFGKAGDVATIFSLIGITI